MNATRRRFMPSKGMKGGETSDSPTSKGWVRIERVDDPEKREDGMIQARLSEKGTAPIWAVVGVPLVAIPMLVALLAWTAPAQGGGVDNAGISGDATVEAVAVGLEYDCGEVAPALHRS